MVLHSLSFGNAFSRQLALDRRDGTRFGRQAEGARGESEGAVALVDVFQPLAERRMATDMHDSDLVMRDIDIDGDGVPDLPHGVVDERLHASLNPGVQVIRFDVSALDDPGVIRNILAQLQAIGKMMQAGQRFQAVSLPLGSDFDFSDLVDDTGQPLPPSRLPEYRDNVKSYLAASEEPALRTRARLIGTIEEIAGQGVPVYISGGNSGTKAANLFNFANLATGVKATDARGHLTYDSAENGLTARAAQGCFAVTKVNGGFDITGDGKADVQDSEVSCGRPIVSRFVGKTPDQVVASPTELMELSFAVMVGKRLHELAITKYKLFSVAGLLQSNAAAPVPWLDPESLAYFALKGDYVLLDNDKPRLFNLDPNGKLVYNADNSGRKNAVNELSSTSWAVQKAIAEDIQAKRLSVTA